MQPDQLAHKIHSLKDVRKTYKNWPRWFLSRMGIHPGGATTTIKVNGSTLFARNNAESWSLADQVWRWKVYTKHFPILDGYRVLDVGAHFGFFSAFAIHQNRDVKVVCYEPSKSTFEMLRKNLAKTVDQGNGFVFNFALSDRGGESAFYKLESHDASGTLFKNNLGHQAGPIVEERVRTEDVQCIWDVFESYDFAKFDCEGSEFAILRRLGEQVKRLHYVVLEYHDNPQEIVQFFVSNNFSILEIVPLDTDAAWIGLSQMGMLYARNDQFVASGSSAHAGQG